MITCAALERPGRWRWVAAGVLLAATAAPAAALLVQACAAGAAGAVGGFAAPLAAGAQVALGVGAVAFGLGLPAGVLAALYRFPGRGPLLAAACLPLLAPSYLWAVAWSGLTRPAGIGACVLAAAPAAIALVLLTTVAALGALSASQVDAARLAGGERVVAAAALRHAAVPALLAAGLAGALTLSDPGPGQVFGVRTAASEVLTSFAALYDFPRAGRQCALLAAAAGAVALPLAALAAPRLAVAGMAREVRPAQPVRQRGASALAAAALASFVAGGVLLPLAGLVWPAVHGGGFGPALAELRRTAADTAVYAAGAGLVAVAAATAFALCVGRAARLRPLCLGACLALFALPPWLGALGTVEFATRAPAWCDPVLRGPAAVCLVQGARFVPIAAVVLLRAWGAQPREWAQAAAVHGVPLGTYLWRVALPNLAPAASVALVLVALLAAADVGTVLLLQPPGRPSFPLVLFTVMANARAPVVAALCLVQAGVAAFLLGGAWAFGSGRLR